MRTRAQTRNSGLRRNYGENPCPYHLALPAAVTYILIYICAECDINQVAPVGLKESVVCSLSKMVCHVFICLT